MKGSDGLHLTGTEAALRLASCATADRFVQIDRAGLIKWSRSTWIRVWQAVAIHSFLDPDGMSGERARQKRSAHGARGRSQPDRGPLGAKPGHLLMLVRDELASSCER